MTLDCLFRNPMQSRVISGGSCYLTSYGYLTFYWFASTTRSVYRISISAIQLLLPRVHFAVHPRLWGSVLLCDLMLPATSCGICVTRYTLYPTSWSCTGFRAYHWFTQVLFDFPGIFATHWILLCVRDLDFSSAYQTLMSFSWSAGYWQGLPNFTCWSGILKI